MLTNAKKMIILSGKKYGLDYIPGAVDSCVLSFSYYRPTKYFEGNCIEVMRGSD